jgi:extensin-like protein
MTTEEPQVASRISRRKLLERIGAGVAVAWTAPILTSVRVPAYAASALSDVQLAPTPSARAYLDEMSWRFPLAPNLGIYSCRHINHEPSMAWSEHSWANAVDLSAPTKTLGDAMYRYALANASRLRITHLLWQVPNHYSHIHADFFPSHDGQVPPCAGGH